MDFKLNTLNLKQRNIIQRRTWWVNIEVNSRIYKICSELLPDFERRVIDGELCMRRPRVGILFHVYHLKLYFFRISHENSNIRSCVLIVQFELNPRKYEKNCRYYVKKLSSLIIR